MGRGRVVEYVLVAGLVSKKQGNSPGGVNPSSQSDSPASGSESYTGSILQRFPVVDRKSTPLPRGIEIFCQPLGWHLTPTPSPPTLTTFILTAEDGKRLFCSSLTFHQLHKQSQRSMKRILSVPMTCNVSDIHRMPRLKTSPSFDYLDEGHEANWSPESIVNHDTHEMYQPVSLCLVSRLPLFDILQSCLKGLYLSWLIDTLPIENLIADLLTQFTLPPVNCLPVKRQFGALREIVLPPIHEEISLPYTSTGAYKLLQSIGVHNMIHVLSTLLSDVSVLFISSSFTALTSATQCVCALLHPLKLSHSLVPVVPAGLVEMVQLPSIYIMGMHSSLRINVEDLGDVVEVYLDDGRLLTPPSLTIPTLPSSTVEPVHRALARVLNPGIEFRDHLFGMGTQPLKPKSIELQDKEVRAVFLCLLVMLLGDYQQFVTVLRFHPKPSFTFNKEGYLQSHASEDSHSLLHKIIDCIPFHDFIHSRSVPFRKCDFFDELLARYSENPQEHTPELLYSQRHITDLAEELIQLLPPTTAKDNQFVTQNLTPQEIAQPCKVFPRVRETRVEQAMQQLMTGHHNGEMENEEEAEEMRDIPFLEISHSKTDGNTSPSFQRDLESLRNCLDALFQSKIIEARKYIPMVTQALKQWSLAHSLVPELVRRVMQVNSVVLSSDQFDILVKIINSALTDATSAMTLLPVSTIMYREINPGVHQHICTYLQHHTIWTKLEFWKSALYSAVQAELVRVYTELELTNQNKMPPKSPRRVTTTCVESRPEDNIVLSDPPEPELGEITLRSRQRLRSSDPATLKAMRRTALSKSMRMRMRASVVLPGVSEGVLPPNAEPVTAQEAMHHLAKQLKKWPLRLEEEQTELSLQEENAVQNQLILFVQRILQVRIPVEFTGYEERETFKEDLLDFISRFLRMVELELNFDFNRHGKIRGQIKDMIQIHIDSLKGLREELKRRPLAKTKAKMFKPPPLEGETLVGEGLHCYLMMDGRENGLLVPADGHIFVTSYRIIFLGTPCNPQAPNVIVTRSFPLASIFRIKRLPPQLITQLAISTTACLQIRTVTAELLRIGFDEDVNQQDIKSLIQLIVDLRNPTKITRGLKPLPPPSPSGMGESVCASSMTASQLISSTARIRSTKHNRGFDQSNILGTSDTLTRVKQISDLSRSPCAQEYERMRLGSLNFSANNRGPWKITALNMTYAVCNGYPAVLVVPERTSDDKLIAVAAQFQHNRFPVVTWKRPNRQAVLLRAGCFVPSSVSQKFGPLGNLPSAVLHGKNRFIGVGAMFGGANKDKGPPESNNMGGTGVFNIDVEGYVRDIMHLSHQRNRQKSNLVNQISGAPETMHFDPDHTSGGGRRRYSGKGVRAKSWGSDDVDYDRRNGDQDRSLTPEPQVDRLYASPEHVKPRMTKRRFTVSNVIQKVRSSSHFRKKQRCRVVVSSGELAGTAGSERCGSPLRESRDAANRGGRNMTLPLEEEGEEEGEEGGKEKERRGGEGGIEGGERETGRSSDEQNVTLSEEDSLDRISDVRKRTLEELGTLSPTRGIPKTYSLKRSASYSGGDREEVDVNDVEMTERSEGSITPETFEPRRKSAIDWEDVGGATLDETPPTLDSRPSTSTPDLPTSPSSRVDSSPKHDIGGINSPDVEGSPATFSILPTNPRDWITVDALPSHLHHWSDSALYIIGDKAALREVPDDLYPNCTFVPVEVPTPSDVSQSFKKLMRACSPSATSTSYIAAVEDSGWITQLSTVMEVAVAVCDLIHIQDSSVLVCLENGWDATAQVVSLAQILLDPYYRTIEGFQALIEKDWLSFGHRFSQNGNHTTSSNISGFTPIFLQFLDLVHQVMKQFPLSFEFSDFYLHLMAYHQSSMRFHTFTLNTEKERYACNWLPYRPRHANLHGSSSQSEVHVSFWDYVDSLHSDLTLLYNFKYKPNEHTGPLCPHSYQANLSLWSFYLDNHLSQFPPYDIEFLSEGELTPVDLHYNFFERDKSLAAPGSGQKGIDGFSLMDMSAGMRGVGTLLLEYTALMNIHAQKKSLPSVSWRELWEELQDSVGISSSSPLLPVQPSDLLMQTHRQTLHKRTTIAVLIKGKLAVEFEDQLTYPHTFEAVSLTAPHECEFCKHPVTTKNAFKCSNCDSICHEHCKSKVPFNCGHKHDITQKKAKKSPTFPLRPSSQPQPVNSALHHMAATTPQRDAATMDGVLYKRGKIVKNWKSRYFVLDPEKRELSYYDSRQLEKCHGTISLTDEDSVEQADPQLVPALKSGETGYFFNLITSKRVYYLMAKSNNERAEWMVRIKNALAVTNV